MTNEETGKVIKLPHAVSQLRRWSAETLTYDMIDAHLEGAPKEHEKDIIDNVKAKIQGKEDISPDPP